jgi:DNA-binding MarR family transcriptional regulator
VTAKRQTRPTNPKFTPLQGQYLAFIRTYTLIHREPPAEMDMQRFFRVTPPSIHNMVLTLEARGLIERVPGKARTIRVLVPFADLPVLQDPIDAGEGGAA